MRFFLLAVCLLLTACQTTPLPPLPDSVVAPALKPSAELGRIVRTSDGYVLTASELLKPLASAAHVLIGERHDHPDHHAVERWLIQALAVQRPNGGIVLEMLDSAQQSAVNSTQSLVMRGESVDIRTALAWSKGWDWAQYDGLVTSLMQQAVPVFSGNFTREDIRRIYQERPTLQGQYTNADAVRHALQTQIRASHCDQLPENQLPAMVAVQQHRDRLMATQLLAAPKPSVLLAGAYHVRRDMGVPLHIRDVTGSDADLLVVLLAEEGQEIAPNSADYVWYLPKLPEQDYCAALRK